MNLKLLVIGVIATLSSIGVVATSTAAQPGAEAGVELSERELARGRILYMQCRACHAVSGESGAKIGPSLAGIFGQPAASVAGYDKYSEPLLAADLVWDEATMDAWIRNPAALVPGNLMAYAGMASDDSRALLVRYLQHVTAEAAEGE